MVYRDRLWGSCGGYLGVGSFWVFGLGLRRAIWDGVFFFSSPGGAVLDLVLDIAEKGRAPASVVIYELITIMHTRILIYFASFFVVFGIATRASLRLFLRGGVGRRYSFTLWFIITVWEIL